MSILNDDLVSVIVPVYNQEKYLERCVASIAAQDHENLEILLVDDGSTDACGEIIDRWAQSDSRIRAFHKSNGGLSDARNYGIEHAGGAFLIFVDSDDWIEANMVSTMLEAMRKENADMVICGYFKDYPDGHQETDTKDQTEYRLFDAETLFRRLLKNEQISFHACRRLYKKALVEKDVFPGGHNYEDVFAVPLLSMCCKTTVYISAALYHYRQNPEGISSSFTFSNKMDYLSAFEHTFRLVERQFPQLERELALSREKHAMVAWDNYLVVDLEDRQQDEIILNQIISLLARIPDKYLPVRFRFVNRCVRKRLPKAMGRFLYRRLVRGGIRSL